MRPDFLSTSEYLVDRDGSLRTIWGSVAVKPVVFIQGLRRSGTTFLLNALQEVTGAAALTVHDIAYYRQRVFGKLNGLEAEQLLKIEAFLLCPRQHS